MRGAATPTGGPRRDEPSAWLPGFTLPTNGRERLPTTYARRSESEPADSGRGWSRLLLVVLVYLAIYLGAGWVATTTAPDGVKADLLSSVGSGAFFHLTFGLIVGAVVLIVFLSGPDGGEICSPASR